MAKKKVQIKASTKVTDSGRKPPVKPQLRSKAPGLFTEKIVFVVNSKKNKS